MKLSLPLSQMPDCYAGPLRVNVLEFNKNIHDRPGVYLEFQEGCGYNPRELTTREARIIAKALNAAADKSDTEFEQILPWGEVDLVKGDEQGEFYFLE